MGMEVRLLLHTDSARADTLAERVFTRIADLEAILSDWRAESELRRLSTHEAGVWVGVSTPVRDVLTLALEVAQATEGAFDPTVGALSALWRESVRTGAPIPDTARSRALAAVGYRFVELDTAGARVRLLRPGMRLDLGAIAKGWILDEALRAIALEDAAGVLLEAGGDIVTRGAAPDGDGWRIAVRTPGGDSVLVVRDAAVSTSSAAAQRTTPRAGAPEGHVFRTSDGRGAVDTPQITVVGTRGAVTDALATALPLLPRDRWAALAARYGVRVIEGPLPDTR
jgi:thiamine biosynthesis lipoprotein